jgi:hypothetical protein
MEPARVDQVAAPTVVPDAAPAAVALPTLRKGMPMTELATYLKEFVSAGNGVKLFANAKVESQWFANATMATIYDLSGSVGRWQAVVDNLFDGDKATADVFLSKVRDAKCAEAAAAAPAAKRAAAAEAKAEAAAKRRATDQKGPEPEAPPRKPAGNAFAALMPKRGPRAEGAADYFQDTLCISVPFPNDFDVDGSTVYKAFRDDPDVHEKMIGWQLIAEGLGATPPVVMEAQAAALEKGKVLLPRHPYFVYHKMWRFRLSSIALQNLAEAYTMTVDALRHKKVNATHFLKMAGAARRACIAKSKAKVPAVSTNEKARMELQADELSKLDKERQANGTELEPTLSHRLGALLLTLRASRASGTDCPRAPVHAARQVAEGHCQRDACKWPHLARHPRFAPPAAGGLKPSR